MGEEFDSDIYCKIKFNVRKTSKTWGYNSEHFSCLSGGISFRFLFEIKITSFPPFSFLLATHPVPPRPSLSQTCSF